MRTWLSLVLLLLLTACIEVADLGTYWDRGATDPAIVGRWQTEDDDGHLATEPSRWTAAIEGGSYVLKGDPIDKPVIVVARTLKAGNQTFFMTDPTGKSEAVLIRYTLKRGVLQLYDLEPDHVQRWLKQHDPAQKNLRVGNGSPRLDTLDDAAFTLMSRLPDDPAYWTPEIGGRYGKVP